MTMMQRGSVQAAFSDVTFFDFQDGFDYRKAEIRESYAKDGQLVPGLWDGSAQSMQGSASRAGSVEVSGPLVSKVEDAPAEDVYLRFVLDYGTRPLWVADAGTNLMLNRTFPAEWEPDKGLLVAFSPDKG